MEKPILEHLQELFPARIDKIRKYAFLDRDFRKLCQEFERTADAVAYLKNLIDVPIEALQKQLEEQNKHLLDLRDEIADFLSSE